jgi:hypothetical protein
MDNQVKSALFTSTKGLNAAQIFELMKVGMQVEYSDPYHDQDSGNFGVVLRRDLQRRRKPLTGQGYYLFNIVLQLAGGQETTISAGQILAYK